MSVTLEQIFAVPESEITRILGRKYILGIDASIMAYVTVAEKYATSGQLVEADMYYIRDNYKKFVDYLIDTRSQYRYSMDVLLRKAMKYVKVENSEIIIRYINRLILQGKVEEAINIRKSYNISETELYDGIMYSLRPKYYMQNILTNEKKLTDYAKVYNLNEPGFILIFKKETDYDVLDLLFVFFDSDINPFSVIDSYFEIYKLPKNKYWFVYSYVVLYSDQNEYTDDFIQTYILDHGLDVEEAEKADLVLLIFMTVVFNTLNGAMYKDLINGYNLAYPNEGAELDSALTYCIRDVFMNKELHYGLDNFNTIYPKVKKPEYLEYGIYRHLLYIMSDYFIEIVEDNLIIDRLTQNTDHIEEVRRIIYSTSPFTKRIL